MITPNERLERMRESFDKDRSVLADDYAYFTAPDATATTRESTRQSKAERKSAEQNERQFQEQNGKQSLDRNGD